MPSATSSSLDIVVIGAGLGGLAAAISCALGGHNVTVLEQARELAEVRVPPSLTVADEKEPRLLTGNCKDRSRPTNYTKVRSKQKIRAHPVSIAEGGKTKKQLGS
jgi:salicylate hydroxylase